MAKKKVMKQWEDFGNDVKEMEIKKEVAYDAWGWYRPTLRVEIGDKTFLFKFTPKGNFESFSMEHEEDFEKSCDDYDDESMFDAGHVCSPRF